MLLWISIDGCRFVNVHNTIEGTSFVEMRKQKRNCRVLVPGDALHVFFCECCCFSSWILSGIW